MEVVEAQEFDFVSVKEEPVGNFIYGKLEFPLVKQNVNSGALSAAQEFEYVDVKTEHSASEDVTAAQELNALQLPACSTKLEHGTCELHSTASPDDVSRTDCIEQVECKVDSEDGGHPSIRNLSHEEANTAPSVRGSGQLEGHSETFTCDSCGDVFSSKYSTVQHVFTHIGGVRPPAHVCRLCGEVFSSSVCLIEHVIGLSRRNKRCAAAANVRTRASLADNQWLSEIFHKVHRLEHGVRRLPSHSGDGLCDCEVCKKLHAQWVSSHSDQTQRNTMCEKTFTQPASSKKHLLIHTGERSHNCDTCGKYFSKNWRLQMHRRMHTEKCQYSCNIYGIAFSGKSNLEVHRCTHAGERPFSCDICGKVFRDINGFHYHLYTHTGQWQYSCDTCGRSFRQSDCLELHRLTHRTE